MSGDVLCFDVETTGLFHHPNAPLARQPHIVEFGAVRLSGKTGKRIDALSVLIKPPISIPEDATRIHGISNVDVHEAPDFATVYTAKIGPLIAKCRLLIAHNAPFDLQMLDLEFRRMSGPAPSLPRALCTIGAYRDRYGYDMKLVDLYKDVTGKTIVQSHRASADVDMLVEIVQKEKLWRF